MKKSFDFKEGSDPVVCQKFKKLSESLDEVLENAYELKTKTFWIDGEGVKPKEKSSNKKKI